jgi:hypothetical protein
MKNEALSDELARIDKIARQADQDLSELKDALKGKKVTAKVQEHIDTFEARFNDYIKALESGADYDRVTRSASHLATYLNSISIGLRNSPSVDENSKDLR